MDDTELAQLRARLDELLDRIATLNEEAVSVQRQIRAEERRRRLRVVEDPDE